MWFFIMPAAGVTSYRLDSLGFEPQLGQDFPYPSRSSPRPTQPLYGGHRVSFPGLKWPECGIDHPPTSNTNGTERAELDLYLTPHAFLAFHGVHYVYGLLTFLVSTCLTRAKMTLRWVGFHLPVTERSHHIIV